MQNLDATSDSENIYEDFSTLTESFTIDLRISSIDNVFPNDAYGDFTTLVAKHYLSDTIANDFIGFFNKHSALSESPLPTNAKAGRKYFDSINAPHLEFSTDPVLTYNNEQYQLKYQSIYNAIKELLARKDILEYCEFNYRPKHQIKDGIWERVYGEQFSAMKWDEAQRSIPSTAKVLSIILYSDATVCDRLGNASEHPVYLSLSNISNWRRQKPDAKVLVAYLPTIKATNKSEKTAAEYMSAKRTLYQKSFDMIISPLLDHKENGLKLITSNRVIWTFPFISIIVGDWPECAAVCTTYASANCAAPCHECLVSNTDLNKILSDNQLVYRTPISMYQAIQDGHGQDVSIHDIDNVFWSYP